MSELPSDLHIDTASSIDEATALLLASPLPVDSPTQRRIRSEEHLTWAFEHAARRPEWVWVARHRDDPAVLGIVAATSQPGNPTPYALDHFGLADPRVSAALVAHATREVLSLGTDEVGIFAPAGSTVNDAALEPLVAPLRAAGWELLVERRHYEFAPPADLGSGAPTALTLTQVRDRDDADLARCHRSVMVDTLDAHDHELIERKGLDQACKESLAYLLDADPVECIHLARDGAGDVVGMVSGLIMPSGRGYLLFVGVANEHRGHGYGRELLAWQSRRLVGAGMSTLIADTDNQNVPMARAFADVGWPQTETRIDLAHPASR